MIKDSFLRKLAPEQVEVMLQERQEFAAKARRVLPRIDWKMVTHPNWRATCPKSGCELTLDILKEELQAYLEEAEEEIKQLERVLEPMVKQLGSNGKSTVKQLELL